MHIVDRISVKANVRIANVKGAMAPGRYQNVVKAAQSVM